jgi:hypothetical protein
VFSNTSFAVSRDDPDPSFIHPPSIPRFHEEKNSKKQAGRTTTRTHYNGVCWI